MRPEEEMKNATRCKLEIIGRGCLLGKIEMPKWGGSIFVGWRNGWESVSVQPDKGVYPSWEDMEYIKSLFWDDDEWVAQYHPAKGRVLGAKPNTMILWKPIDQELPTPPSAAELLETQEGGLS